MARIAGINIPDQKHAVIALTSIYGVGKTQVLKPFWLPRVSLKMLRSVSCLKNKSTRCVTKLPNLSLKVICAVKLA